MRCEVTLPKNLQEKRDAMCEAYKQECLDNWHCPGLYLKPDFKKGFEEACKLLLPEIEKIHTALKEWIAFEHSQIDIEGPYVGMEINRLINQGDKALQSLREFLGKESEGGE